MATNSSRIPGDAWRTPRALDWSAPAPGVLVAAAARGRTALDAVRHEALKDGMYLVPVRAFIGIGWLRAFAEKITEPGWRDGTSLAMFLEHQVQTGMVAFAPYQTLLTGVFLWHALALGWIVIIAQLLTGAAILTGSLTRAALLGGIFMNLNFLLAGEPDPSAFYIVIQAVLLISGAGAVFAVDTRIAGRGHPAGLQPSLLSSTPVALALAMLACAAAVCAIAHIRDWSPAGSVRDPAAVLAVLALMAASWFAIGALRGDRLPSTS
jgi:thiosulfate dehydrogenase (quinone) large subunit